VLCWERVKERKGEGKIRIEKREGTLLYMRFDRRLEDNNKAVKKGVVGGWLLTVVHNFYYV
jgi:hypothetical protein